MSKLKQGVTIWQLGDLVRSTKEVSIRTENGFIPARPLGWQYGVSHKIRAAWLVLQSKADVVVWPGNQ